MCVCVGRCRNSSRATINPDTKETQQHGKHTELGFMHWRNFTEAFFPPARAFLQNIGHWLAVRKESGILLFPHRATHSAVPAASARCTRLAHRATCLSAGKILILEMMGGRHFHPIKSHFQDKTTCFAGHPVPTKPPARAHTCTHMHTRTKTQSQPGTWVVFFIISRGF